MRCRLGVTIVAVGIAAACARAPDAPSPISSTTGTQSTAHFTFQYTARDADTIATMAAALEAQQARVVGDLGSSAMPVVTVTLYSDHDALAAAVRPAAGAIPSWSSGLVTAQNQIHMMSPNAAGWGPIDAAMTNLVHEFAHCVSLHVNPRIGNNPRWFWEAVAIYEARQSVDPRTLSYMTAHAPPSFDRLNQLDNTLVYDVGFTIGEFIVARWGATSLHDLIVANGDTVSVLGTPLQDFEHQWFVYVRERYGI